MILVLRRSFYLGRLPFTAVKKLSTQADSVDKEDVSFHGKNASTWWDEFGQFASLHSFNEVRVPFIKNGLENCNTLVRDQVNTRYPLKNLKILDAGCGGGILTEALGRIGADITGLDPSSELINIAKSHASEDPSIKDIVKYAAETVEEHAKSHPNTYDAVVSSEVIEHVTNVESFLRNLLVTVKVGGSLFLTTPNRTELSRLLVITLAESINVLPKGTHDYSKFIHYSDLLKLLNKLNCTVRSTTGLILNPFTNRVHMTKCKELWYAVHAVKRSQ